MEIIKTIDLTKRYKDLTAVDKLNLQINQGEIFALLGVNGAGKTTTIKMLSCLTQPTSGEAFVGDHSITDEPMKVKQIIGVSPQETAVALNLSVLENLQFMCGLHGLSKTAQQSKIKQLSEQFSLGSVLHKKAATLSGGWKQRLSIAMALVSDPSILFLDEPTLGFDVISRSVLWDILYSLKKKVTIVLTTHYMEEAEALSDRIGIMKAGKLLITGTVAELLELTGENKFERAFISIIKGATK